MSRTDISIQRIYKTIPLLLLVYIISCSEEKHDYGGPYKESKVYVKGDLVNRNSGERVNGMIITCFDAVYPDKIESIDSIGKDGSYLVYYTLHNDHYVPNPKRVQIVASSSSFFGDTILYLSNVKIEDLLKQNILVKPVGRIILNLHNLVNVQKIILSTLDNNVSVLGYIRNYKVLEFKPSSADTTLILPAYPDRENWFGCWFNEYSVGGTVFDSTFNINSGETIFFNIYH